MVQLQVIMAKVCKFGGTSMADAGQVKKAADIIMQDGERKAIVVSAPGKRYKNDAKITDMLIELAKTKDSTLYKSVMGRYKEIYQGDISDVANILKDRLYQDLPEGAYLDSIKAFGEEAMARIFAKIIGAQYVDPIGMINVTDDFGKAKVLQDSYHDIRIKLLNRNGVFVVPGFYGYTKTAQIATFGRGGSDLTGAILAAALNAEVYENFTDVDGMYAADPKIVENPKTIDEITYREARELAYTGASVLQRDCMLPVMEKSIPINIRNTNNLSHKGTMVVPQRSKSGNIVTGISQKSGFCMFNFYKAGMNEEKGAVYSLLGIFADSSISFEHAATSVDSFKIAVHQGEIKNINLDELCSKISEKTGVNARYEPNKSILCIVGEGMEYAPGISGRVDTALGKANVNIEFESQASEVNIVRGIKAEDASKAVKTVYKEFFS